MILVRRSQWRARAPRHLTKLELNAKPTGHWNGEQVSVRGETIFDHANCAGLVRGIQNYHMDGHGWSDIAYNFVICPHGYVFEGRGVDVVNAANGTNDGNRSSHAIMWLAGRNNRFSDVEKEAFYDTVLFLAYVARTPADAIGHRDHHSTECPGEERYRWIHSGMNFPGKNKPTAAPNTLGPHTVLRLGDRGDSVRQVQRVISAKAGGNIQIDGVFGPGTERRVKDLQRFFKVEADGIVGSKTWDILEMLAAH